MMSTDRPFVREPAQRRDGYGFTIPKKVPIAPEQAPRTVTGNAVYVAGKRVASPASLAETATLLRTNPEAMAWIGLYQPDPDDL
ncbi:MAG: transporter, partial [Propionibacteriaceae bacterium]|nr:transporter [Propionibacteriaceae bacterium]